MANNIYTLGSQHFNLTGTNTKTLTISPGGQVFVLFRSAGCNVCKAFEPIYRAIAPSFIGAKFTVVDVDANRDVINKTRQTAHPVQSVPTLFFYNEKNPFAKYKGDFNRNDVVSFITAVLENSVRAMQQPVQSQQRQSSQYQPPAQYHQPSQHIAPAIEDEDDDKLSLPNMAFLPKERPWDHH